MSYVEQYMVSGSDKVGWTSSILLKLVAIILILTFLVIAVSGYFAYRYIEQEKTAELANLAEVTAERLSQHLNSPMWAVDYEKVGTLLDAEMNELKIVGLVVRDEDRKTLFAGRERFKNGEVADSLGAVIGNFVAASRDIVRNDKVIGTLDVYLTRQYLAAEIKQFALGLSGLAVLLGFALTLTIAVSLSSLVVKPIKKLTQSAQRISNGDLKQKIEVDRMDEIGFLAGTLDRMQYSLRVAITRIRNADARQSKVSDAA